MYASWSKLVSPWVGALAAAGVLVATVGACSKESDDTGGGGSGGSTTSSTHTTSFTTTPSTTTGGGGEGGDPQAICDAAAAKEDECGVGQGGGGGGGVLECDEMRLCQAHCILDASCQDMQLMSPNYSGCISCCFNPAGC